MEDGKDNRRPFRPKGYQELRKNPSNLPEDFVAMYGVYGDPIASYEDTFQHVLHGKKISELLQGKNQPVLVMDLMAPTDTLADLFQLLPGIEKKGIAVGLSDMRSFIEGRVQRDDNLNIHCIATKTDLTQPNDPHSMNDRVGDLLKSATWDEVDKALGDQKADLIMERGVAGIMTVPHYKLFYRTILQRIWDRLDSNEGIFLGQTLTQNEYQKMGIDFAGWIEKMRSSGIDPEYNESIGIWSRPEGTRRAFGTLKLIRHHDSQEALPTI